MRASIKSRVLAVLGAMIMPIVAMADYTCTTNGYEWSYSVSDGAAKILGVPSPMPTNLNSSVVEYVAIPTIVDGYPVKSLAHFGCGYDNWIGCIVGYGIERLENRCFYWSGLKSIVIPQTVRYIGSQAVGLVFAYMPYGPCRIYWSTPETNNDSDSYDLGGGMSTPIYIACAGEMPYNISSITNIVAQFKCKSDQFENWRAVCGADKFKGLVGDGFRSLDLASVNFDCAGGGAIAPQVYTQGMPYVSLPIPERIGYQFNGWYTCEYPSYGYPDGIKVDNFDIFAFPGETLYARWTPLRPTWEVQGSSVIYDGSPHGITVMPTAPVEGVTVKYALAENGPYSDTSPTLTEAGTTNVWYVLKAPDWEPLTNSATLKITKLVSDATVAKSVLDDGFVYDGSAKRPGVALKDTAAVPNLNVTAYAPGDADGDGVLSQNDATLIQRYNAYQALSDAMKETFASYNLTGNALVAADVNQDGIVNADDVTTLNGKFSGYELVEGSDYTLAYSDNVNVGTGKVTITGKGNYGGTAILEFTIAKATIGADGEPGSGTVPDGGKSKFDATYTYDGLPHTIDTNALAAVRIDGVVPSLAYSLNGIDGWQVEPFVFTNVCVTSVWYRMSVANYNDYIHEARLTITPKSIGDPTVAVAIDYDPDSGNPPLVSIADESIFRWQFVMSYAPGDVDGDGVLSDEDVDLIGQYLGYLEMDDSLKPFFEEYNLSGAALSAADYNGDGVVDEADANALEASFYTLVEGVDYTVSVGESAVSLSGFGNYSGVVRQAFKPIEIQNVTAKQRYPWNGKVDIDCKVSGIYETIYRVKFAIFAVDRDLGNTNKVSHFWVVRDGVNSNDRVVHTNGEYRLVWDARADLGEAIYSNMVVSVSLVEDVHNGIQLWDGGPYWAETNIGAKKPWEYGCYFWWGDIVGYRYENDAWVASDGSSSNFSFEEGNAPTYNKSISALQSEGWITADGVLAPEHDAAQVQWGDGWHMPTIQECDDLTSKCDWTFITTNGVSCYVIRGRGDYADNCILLPYAGTGFKTSSVPLYSDGYYWLSTPYSDSVYSHSIFFDRYPSYRRLVNARWRGYPIRPVQSFSN